MYEAAHNADGLVAALMLVAAMGAYFSRRTLFVYAFSATAAVQLVLIALMWMVDWSLVDGRVVVETPLLVIPVALIWWRRRDRWVRGVLVVAALSVLSAAFFTRPTPRYVDDMALHWLPVIVAGAGFALAHKQRVVLARKQRVVLAIVAAIVVPSAVVAIAWQSRLPDRIGHETDGQHANGQHANGQRGASIAELQGPQEQQPDRRFTLTAQEGAIALSSGRRVSDGLTFNGQAPGPLLRVTRGDLVEVTLVNRLSTAGVTIHWHGLHVPNAEDGVAGVTQDAVPPGGSHRYRFVADQVGTYWYHTHQEPLWLVRRGLFGAILVEPENPSAATEVVVMPHEWRLAGVRVAAFGVDDTWQERRVGAGERVRVRLINTDNNPADDASPRSFAVVGVPFRVTAIDGVDLNRPTDLANVALGLATGGRMDLEFVMPDRPVKLVDLGAQHIGMVLNPGTGAVPPLPENMPDFDPAGYGTPLPVPLPVPLHGFDSGFDSEHTMLLDDRMGFYDGTWRLRPTINGKGFPDTSPIWVRRGNAVKIRIVNRSHQNHPIHLHGHHMLVLSRSGRPVTGSPWWTDSLDVRPGQVFEVAFRADNPGVWMNHCHNLDHAANGMVMHLAYVGYYSPFEVGRATGNLPE